MNSASTLDFLTRRVAPYNLGYSVQHANPGWTTIGLHFFGPGRKFHTSSFRSILSISPVLLCLRSPFRSQFGPLDTLGSCDRRVLLKSPQTSAQSRSKALRCTSISHGLIVAVSHGAHQI